MRQGSISHNHLEISGASVRYGMDIPELKRQIRNHFGARQLSADD
jgi:hypothetical protein